MPHGTPDWGNVAAQSTVKITLDNAELAARLGSPNTFERGGNVLYQTSFEQGLSGINHIHNGTNSAVTLDTVESKTGAYSAKLTAGSDGLHLAELFRNFAYPSLSVVGLEVGMKLLDLYDYFYVAFQLFDGVSLWDNAIRHNQTTKTLGYWSSAGAWVTFATNMDWQAGSSPFHVFKLRADFDAKTYGRCTVDNVEYDLRSIPLQQLASAVVPQQTVMMVLTGRLANNDVIYLDDIIVTQNEPV